MFTAFEEMRELHHRSFFRDKVNPKTLPHVLDVSRNVRVMLFLRDYRELVPVLKRILCVPRRKQLPVPEMPRQKDYSLPAGYEVISNLLIVHRLDPLERQRRITLQRQKFRNRPRYVLVDLAANVLPPLCRAVGVSDF